MKSTNKLLTRSTSDPLHDLQLLKDLQIINERTMKELGPLPPDGLPVQKKRKPKPWNPDAFESTNLWNENEEDEAMRPQHAVVATALAVAGLLTACGAGSSSSNTNNEKNPETSVAAHPKPSAVESHLAVQQAAHSASKDATHMADDLAASTTAASLQRKNRYEDQQTSATEGARSEDAASSAIESRELLTVPGVPNGTLKTGMDYADLRRAILARGWVPVVNARCKTNIAGGDELCDRMPELSDCSADGYCLMHFHLASTDQNMEVGTYGDTSDWDVQAKDSQLAVTGLTITPASAR